MPTAQAIACLSGTLFITIKVVKFFVRSHVKRGYTESLKIIENQEETRKTTEKTRKNQETPRKTKKTEKKYGKPRKLLKTQENPGKTNKPRKTKKT